jgi:ABC-type hemin transport system ATPase subunit
MTQQGEHANLKDSVETSKIAALDSQKKSLEATHESLKVEADRRHQETTKSLQSDLHDLNVSLLFFFMDRLFICGQGKYGETKTLLDELKAEHSKLQVSRLGVFFWYYSRRSDHSTERVHKYQGFCRR